MSAPVGLFAVFDFEGVVSGGGEAEIAVDVKAVAEAVELDFGEDARLSGVLDGGDGDFAGAPVAQKDEFAGGDDGLRLAGADGGEVLGLVGVGDVEELRAVDAMGDEADAVAGMDAGGELGGVVASDKLGPLAVGDVEDPESVVTRREEEEVAGPGKLTATTEALDLVDEARLEGLLERVDMEFS